MAKRGLLHLSMLEAGYLLTRRGFMNLSLALEQADYDGFLSAFDEFIREYADLV
jgi:hypothetical protein